MIYSGGLILTSLVLLPYLWLKNEKTAISVSLLALSGCNSKHSYLCEIPREQNTRTRCLFVHFP